MLAVLVGLLGSITLVEPAHAAVVHAYYGNRGHAWSNTAATRIGVEDQRNDGIRIYADGLARCVDLDLCVSPDLFLQYDVNNNEPGYSVYVAPPGYRVSEFRVCGIWNGAPSGDYRGCSEWRFP
ncbi:hypothetical protein ACIA5D_51590 [Actinoplanes sp. NPDC051513]|uniref:hypothetical protein n=1 Tax=Actinoplanes sp. NPDC051513 TaxID=3363908 RepID=UPI00379B04C2